MTLSGPAADAELNVGTFVSVITLFCALQFPLRLVPELVFASFRFARLLPQFERAFSYLLFCWVGHDEFSQSAEIQPWTGCPKGRDRRVNFYLPRPPARLTLEPSRHRSSLVIWCPFPPYESAASADTQIINPLGIDQGAGYRAWWMWIGPPVTGTPDCREPGPPPTSREDERLVGHAGGASSTSLCA
jgi:hypothetical protein